jgi:hypothetical protein
MRRFVVLLAVVATAAWLAPARAAEVEGPVGRPCAMALTGDGQSATAVFGGAAYAASGTVTCTVRIGGWGVRHSDRAAGSVSASLTGAVVVPLTTATFPLRDWEYAEVCTTYAAPGGPTLYWTVAEHAYDDLPDAGHPSRVAGHWSTDPSSLCRDPGCQFCPIDPLGPVDDVGRLVDAYTCPVLAALAGTYGVVTVTSDGDVYLAGELFWDCPPPLVAAAAAG